MNKYSQYLFVVVVSVVIVTVYFASCISFCINKSERYLIAQDLTISEYNYLHTAVVHWANVLCK